MNIQELRKKLTDLINTKINLVRERIDNLEKDFIEFKTREVKRDTNIENKLTSLIETKRQLLEEKINKNLELIKNQFELINKNIDKKIENINEVFYKKFNEVAQKNYDEKIKKLENDINEIKENQKRLEEKIDEIYSILT